MSWWTACVCPACAQSLRGESGTARVSRRCDFPTTLHQQRTLQSSTIKATARRWASPERKTRQARGPQLPAPIDRDGCGTGAAQTADPVPYPCRFALHSLDMWVSQAVILSSRFHGTSSWLSPRLPIRQRCISPSPLLRTFLHLCTQRPPVSPSHICKARVPVFRNLKPLSSQPRSSRLMLDHIYTQQGHL